MIFYEKAKAVYNVVNYFFRYKFYNITCPVLIKKMYGRYFNLPFSYKSINSTSFVRVSNIITVGLNSKP